MIYEDKSLIRHSGSSNQRARRKSERANSERGRSRDRGTKPTAYLE